VLIVLADAFLKHVENKSDVGTLGGRLGENILVVVIVLVQEKT